MIRLDEWPLPGSVDGVDALGQGDSFKYLPTNHRKRQSSQALARLVALGAPEQRRLARLLTFLAICSATTACNGFARACEGVGVCDPPPLSTIDAAVLIDASPGSSGNAESLTATVERVARAVAPRPGSRLTVWWLGASLEDTRPLAPPVLVPPFVGGAKRALGEQDRFVRETVAHVRTAAQARLAQRPPMRTPLAAGLTQVAQAAHSDLDERLVVVVSDLRETVVASFECGLLPSLEHWHTLLAKEGALPQNSFQGARVFFAYAVQAPIPRCPVDLNRQQRLRQLWSVALKGAGAREVEFEIDAPTLTSLSGK